ncbi:MAG TPA: DNA/RNA non-specific endonuclease [Pirellulales bacterium]
MAKKKFLNAPLRSLLKDSAVVAELKLKADQLPAIAAESTGVGSEGVGRLSAYEGLGGRGGVAPAGMLDRGYIESLEARPESLDGNDFGPREAIILLSGRPPLLIQDDKWEDPQIEEIRQRLNQARAFLEAAIPQVGRIEITNQPGVDYIGTGWMIDEDVLITNAHVANLIAVEHSGTFMLQTTPFGAKLRVQVDFKEEHEQTSAPIVRKVRDVLYIADGRPGSPDMALIRLDSGRGLPAPIQLSTLRLDTNSDVAAIGYPASDGGRNDPFIMAEIFRNVYDVKRLSPGRISAVRPDRLLVSHDCTTLGGSSGSVLINLADGKAAGLHFQGRYMDENLAVSSEGLRSRLIDLGGRAFISLPLQSSATPAAPAAPTTASTPAAGSEERTPTLTQLSARTGYDARFLGEEVPLPKVAASVVLAPVSSRTDNLLHYTHFTIAMHKERRLAVYTAVNIDGGKAFNVTRGGDQWNRDPRLDNAHQTGNELYRGNRLDRGHLVRRLDPVWGESRAEAEQACEDTFFYTNSHPQHEQLNQQTWLSLENYILDNAKTHKLKVVVFTGPVFTVADRTYRGVQIPAEYWKVVVVRNAVTDRLSATGYLLSQADLIRNDLEFVFGAFKTYQLPIKTIQTKTGLTFALPNGDQLTKYDPLNLIESLASRVIEGPTDLLL